MFKKWLVLCRLNLQKNARSVGEKKNQHEIN